MTKLKNKEKVAEIIMKPTAICKCRIGQDWYKMAFCIVFIPDESYPDYMEVNEFVMQEIDGKELNIEEAARIIYDKLTEYKPLFLQVTNNITGCKTHFDVAVTINSDCQVRSEA